MFWIYCFLLIILTSIFLIPWLSEFKIRLAVLCFLCCFSFASYFATGGWKRQSLISKQENDKAWEAKRLELRHMLNAFKKQEFKLRQQLSEHPEDSEAEYRLMDLMAIKSLQQGNVEAAKLLWQNVLSKIPKNKETREMRLRIQNSLENL